MCANHINVDLTLPSDLGEARLVQMRIEEALVANTYTESEVFAIKLAVEEALVNAIKHGNQLNPDKNVNVSFQVTCERFDIKIADEGPGFNPEDVPDPTDPDNIERTCGRGLLLIRGFMTDVQYHGRGNVVTMSKVRGESPPDDS
jgi:serine/threonine-protein kinase RsbW